jgi:hypothetical protein
MSDFRRLIDTEGLPPEEAARLERVHELLVRAGPPPDLPPSLANPPTRARQAEIVQFPLLPGRRWAVAAVVAAAVAAAAFGGGYALGHHKAKPAAFATTRVIPMHGRSATALIRVAKRDSVGNWPMLVEVTGLPSLRSHDAYYELWLTRHGRPTEPCGQFRVHGKTTRIRLNVPWSFKGIDGWVVTRQQDPRDNVPGPVVLTT